MIITGKYSFHLVDICNTCMSNRQVNDCSTNLVLLRLSLAEGRAKPSLPIGTTPVLHESRQIL